MTTIRNPIEDFVKKSDSVQAARDLGNHFQIGTNTTSTLQEEFQRTHIEDIRELSRDITKCRDAVTTDRAGIQLLNQLLADPNNLALQEEVKKNTTEDIRGENMALRDNPNNARRSAYVAALNQAVLDHPDLRSKLTPQQIKMIERDRDLKLQDARNCFEDIPNEMNYLQDNKSLLRALRDPQKFAQLKNAVERVKANKEKDIRLEGTTSENGSVATGYIGQSEESVRSDIAIAREFNPNADLKQAVGENLYLLTPAPKLLYKEDYAVAMLPKLTFA